MENNKLKGCFMHESDHWKTPNEIYEFFEKKEFKDPCPYMSKENNLNKKYNNENLFINPPYSDITTWIDFSINHIKENPLNTIALLIPSRTDTKYFHKLLENENLNIGIYFFKGKLKFNDGKNGAPFPSILVFITYNLKTYHTIIDDYKKFTMFLLNAQNYYKKYLKQLGEIKNDK